MSFSRETISSGVDALDDLLHGGIERGTISIISGPSGVGKTTTGSLFAKEAARQGERSVIYLFEESKPTFVHRSEALGVPVTEMADDGSLAIHEVEASTVSPQEFAASVRTEVEDRNAQMVVVDGIDGYRLSVQGTGDAVLRSIHSLGRYLKNMGTTGIFVSEVRTITGEFTITEEEHVSYLADTILFLRYLEYHGELRKAIGVLKKRASDFERTLREFEIREGGVYLGDPLTGLRGILQGTPDWNVADE
ncbi:MAG: ATPase domain-containing protein [Halanaeroarchaeum sp.]